MYMYIYLLIFTYIYTLKMMLELNSLINCYLRMFVVERIVTAVAETNMSPATHLVYPHLFFQVRGELGGGFGYFCDFHPYLGKSPI